MTGTCICCGRAGKVQRHHPGRRSFTDITVPVCGGCHTILTIWDGGIHGERQWSPETADVIRVKTGIADVLNLTCVRIGGHEARVEIEQIIKEFGPLFTVRYSTSDTAYDIKQITPDNRTQQITEIRTMMERYLKCPTT